ASAAGSCTDQNDWARSGLLLMVLLGRARHLANVGSNELWERAMAIGTSTAAVIRQRETSREEWDTRVQLAACYRIFDMLGWTEMIFNHITLRVPGPQRHFLINPFGLWYREVTASNLVKIDIDGNVIGESDWPVNRAGFVIHSAIHAAREDAHCIM